MGAYCLVHLGDGDLERALVAAAARDRAATASLLAHLAEFDARRLYLPAGYPSMYLYTVHELRLSEDAALKRIRAARTARQFPGIFESLADGRLSLSAIVMLASYLTTENAAHLIAAAEDKTKAEVERLLAERFPRSELLALVEAIPGSPPPPGAQLAPGPVASWESPARGASHVRHIRRSAGPGAS